MRDTVYSQDTAHLFVDVSVVLLCYGLQYMILLTIYNSVCFIIHILEFWSCRPQNCLLLSTQLMNEGCPPVYLT